MNIELVNICEGATAKQSSLSEWSTAGEADNALTGCDHPFAFHTDLQPRPWWRVDFRHVYGLHLIKVFNRRDAAHDRAFRLQIEVSLDGTEWTLIHAGFTAFGLRPDHALTINLGGLIFGRYLKLSLPTEDYLHLYKVEVFSSVADIAFQRYCEGNGFNGLRGTVRPPESPQDYQLISQADWSANSKIIGLSISHAGRFGNYLQQLTHAIKIAEATGLQYIRLADQPAFMPRGPSSSGIVFLRPDAELPSDGGFIEGVFFDPSPFQPLLKPFLVFGFEEERMHSEIGSRVIRPDLFAWAPAEVLTHDEQELIVHVRSGDIFQGGGNLGYRQPPLAFYKLSINNMIKTGIINRVKMVYEDIGNPIILPLQNWLHDRGVPLRIQSASLKDDIVCMIDAPHIMFGFGTFGYGICRLSKRIRTLHYFEPEIGGSYRHAPMIDTVVAVIDKRGDYVQAWNRGARPSDGDWRNTPEQRTMMIEYPADALAVKVLKSPIKANPLMKAALRLSGSLQRLPKGPTQSKRLTTS